VTHALAEATDQAGHRGTVLCVAQPSIQRTMLLHGCLNGENANTCMSSVAPVAVSPGTYYLCRMEETLFDKILRGEIPADVVYEDDYVLSFRDINPQAPVHVLVIPRTKITSLAESTALSVDTVGHFIHGVTRTARALQLEEGGYRVVFNTGADAQQSVPYVHAHILGGRKLSWPPG